MAVLCDGTVVPCCLDGNGVMNLGNIFTTDLTDILENERSRRFMEGFRAKRAVEPLCIHCSFKERFSNKL
jgi:radical SAM protein with 4Fe4S-binding SPASM domain